MAWALLLAGVAFGQTGPGSYAGEAAIARLGSRLDEVAARHGLSGERLRRVLREDPSARITDEGRWLYAEPLLAEAAPGAGLPTNPDVSQIPDAVVFQLHSRPGATAVLYINYLGGTFQSPAWASGAPVQVEPYSRDSTPAFSTQELQDIKEHWLSVAEDYAPFDLDVTTELPAVVDPLRYIEIVVTPTWQWYGAAGGVCDIGSFTGGRGVHQQVCWVFSSLLMNTPRAVKETIAHEAGHAFGLQHWQLHNIDGSLVAFYYSGNGLWAPIMGVSYTRPHSTWSDGDYVSNLPFGPFAPQQLQQDDVAQIAQRVGGPLADDVGDTLGTATNLPTGSGTISLDLSGLIGSRADVDVFRVQTAPGDLTLTVQPWATAPNLDLRVRFFSSGGLLLEESDPPGMVSASVQRSALPAGTWFLEVSGVGRGDFGDGGYSDYGSLGRYRLVGSYVSAVAPIDAGGPMHDGGSGPTSDGGALDAGRDAGSPDAGPPDGGVVDAGLDAGRLDAGPAADGGVVDGGLDAGRPDAGPAADGGVVDEGLDAGSPDSGTPDAASNAPDAGSSEDAGASGADAGSPEDAGVDPDAGSSEDAGVVIDAGRSEDAGVILDIGCFGQSQRTELMGRSLLKPCPTDDQLFAAIDDCLQYPNLELEVCGIAGLPFATPKSLDEEHRLLERVLERGCKVGYQRLQSQPGALVTSHAERFGMVSEAVTFDDFHAWFSKRTTARKGIPMIHFRDEGLEQAVRKNCARLDATIAADTERREGRLTPRTRLKTTLLTRREVSLGDWLGRHKVPSKVAGTGVTVLRSANGAGLACAPGLDPSRFEDPMVEAAEAGAVVLSVLGAAERPTTMEALLKHVMHEFACDEAAAGEAVELLVARRFVSRA